MPAASAPAAVPAPLTLISGPQEFLADRAVAGIVAAARAADPSVEICDLAPDAFVPGAFAELVSPSLFGSAKVVVLRDVQDLEAAGAEAVKKYLADPAEEIVLVLTHPGGVKGKALLDAVRKFQPVEIDCPKLAKPADRAAFVRNEFRQAKRKITDEAAQLVADAVGSDLRELAAAAGQLVSDTEGVVDEAVVGQYYTGQAEASGFAIADLVLDGRTAEALVQLRFALDTGVAPVLLVSALASGLRNLGKAAAAGSGGRAGDLGMPPWMLEKARRQSRNWNPQRLTRAVLAVARADAEVKGAAADPAYALERCVVEIAKR
ncbi:MAG TPA: DNA polymerase III subunit delta [Actinocrinis sp.]|nr:DNA polymerase III subunit delta [Actinocrinis sp.]